MRGKTGEDEPFEDFSVAARVQLVAMRGGEIRMLLDKAFSDFVDAEPAVSFADFGFRGDDPIAEAVSWAIDRFTSAEFDLSRVEARSRSFRIFTEVRFWLSQKAGRAGYRRLIAGARRCVPPEPDDAPTGDVAATTLLDDVAAELARELPGFRDRTCNDLVGFWLAGTKRVRRDWFGWREHGALSGVAEDLSKRQRSIYAYDAMFRFLCCFHRLAPVAPAERAELAFVLTSLSGCPDVPPYRVAASAVVALSGAHEVARLRREGARRLLQQCLDIVDAEGMSSTRERLVAAFTQQSLGLTTLHALGLEEDRALHALVREVCEATKEGVP